MGRAKTTSDDAVLDATERVLLRRGPHDFTLVEIAREAGIAAPTILQRFGTKRALVVAFARRSAERAAAPFARSQGPEADPLATLRAALRALTRGMRSRKGLANSLALLLEDIRDEELRAAAREHADRTEDALTEHIASAIARGEIRGEPSARELARLLQAAFNGAIIQWALHGKGKLDAWVDRTVDTFFASLRTSPTPGRAGRARRAPGAVPGRRSATRTSTRSRS